MTQVVSVLDTSTPTSRILEDSCSSDEHAPHVKFLQILQDLEMTRLSLYLALQVAEGAWGNTTSGGLSLKHKLYPCGCPETVTDLPLVSEGSGAERHACSPPQ